MKRIPLLLPLAFLALLAACATTSGPAGQPAPEPLACREIEGLAPLLAPGAALLLGDMHGTVEIPAFAGNAACLALKAGRPVTLALEIPRSNQERVDAFLVSEGTAADRQAVIDSPFWTGDYQDGRGSEAMLALIEEARRLRQQGRPIRITLVDWDQKGGGAPRDRSMGEALATAARQVQAEGGVLISMAGNVHSRITRGTPWEADYEPAGFVMVREAPDLSITALEVAYAEGTAWTCTSGEVASCGVRPLRGRGDAQGGRIVLHSEVKNGHHGLFHIGPPTASPPAVRTQSSGS